MLGAGHGMMLDAARQRRPHFAEDHRLVGIGFLHPAPGRMARQVHADAAEEVGAEGADFLADAKKPHRKQPELGVGRWRYFLCPEGLIQPEEVPERWGLLWATKRNGVRPVCGPVAHLPHMLKFGEELARHAFEQRDIEREMAMLAKTLHRIPDIETLNKRLREANNHSQHLIKKIEGQRTEIQRLQQRVMELNLRLNADASPVTPPAAPQRRTQPARTTLPGTEIY